MVGRSFSHKFQSNPITEEDDAIDTIKSEINDKELLKTDKIDLKSSKNSQTNDKDDKIDINSSTSCKKSDKEDKDDFPELPMPPKICLGFMRNRGENPYLSSASSSLSTSTLSTSTTSSIGEKTKLSSSFVGLSKSRSTLNKFLSETDHLLASTNVTPHVFVEPKPVASFVKPALTKCHPDTPRPSTDSPPVVANKENAIPPPSRRCLETSLDNTLKSSSPATSDSLSLSGTLKACTITVRENINDTVLFENKPFGNLQAASALPTAKNKISQGSVLLSSSLLAQKPETPVVSQYDNGDKLDLAFFQPDSALMRSEENQSSIRVTPAKFTAERSQPQERSLESAEATPLPELSKFKSDGLLDSNHCNYPSSTERVTPLADMYATEKSEKSKLVVDSCEVEKSRAFLPDKAHNPTALSKFHHKELLETDKIIISEAKPEEKPRLLQEPLQSVEKLSHSKRPEPNTDRHHSVLDAKLQSSCQESAQREQPLQKSVSACVNEFVPPQPLMNKGKISNNSELVSSKTQLPLDSKSSDDKIQLEKQCLKSTQLKSEMQPQKSAQEKPLTQRNR